MSKFKTSVMNIRIDGMVSDGMYKAVLAHVKKEFEGNRSSYLRELIKRDLKIDDYGRPVTTS
ncbi:MAG TPA: hypothetical protein VEB40_00870 [Flavipsychrobacter sp.]|nr:hypothetical protein [Flavipsychrobacter sp.]